MIDFKKRLLSLLIAMHLLFANAGSLALGEEEKKDEDSIQQLMIVPANNFYLNVDDYILGCSAAIQEMDRCFQFQNDEERNAFMLKAQSLFLMGSWSNSRNILNQIVAGVTLDGYDQPISLALPNMVDNYELSRALLNTLTEIYQKGMIHREAKDSLPDLGVFCADGNDKVVLDTVFDCLYHCYDENGVFNIDEFEQAYYILASVNIGNGLPNVNSMTLGGQWVAKKVDGVAALYFAHREIFAQPFNEVMNYVDKEAYAKGRLVIIAVPDADECLTYAEKLILYYSCLYEICVEKVNNDLCNDILYVEKCRQTTGSLVDALELREECRNNRLMGYTMKEPLSGEGRSKLLTYTNNNRKPFYRDVNRRRA